MTDRELVAALRKRVAGGSRYEEIAVACGASESGVRKWLSQRRVPHNKFVRAALERFLNGRRK